jgi:hypothetical protein
MNYPSAHNDDLTPTTMKFHGTTILLLDMAAAKRRADADRRSIIASNRLADARRAAEAAAKAAAA